MFKNKALIPIAVVVFVDLLGFSIILPLLPFYAATFQAGPELIGYLVASYSVCQFIAAPILGGLSDRFGRRPLLIYSQIGSMLGFIMLGLANSLPMLFISRIIDGLSGGNITIAAAYIADVTEPKDRAGAMAIIGIGFGLGFMVGPLIGGTLATHFGYAVPAFVAAGFAASSTLLTTFYLKEYTHKPDPNAKKGLAQYTRVFDYFKIPNLRTLLTIFLFFALPFSLYVSMFSLYAKIELNFTPEQVGEFLAFIGVVGVIWQGGVVRPLVKRFGEVNAMRAGMIALMLGLLGIVIATNWWQLGLVAIVFSFGTGITRPTISSLISQASPPGRRGGAMGVSSSIESFSRSVAPILGGWIIGGLYPNYIGYVGAFLAAIGLVLAFLVKFDSHEVTGEIIID
ncbi:MAG: MFS transporter [Candidatus Kapaibacterium sp.]|jgi:DHA1 family tetracycline resistance protein-like MFS transporter